MQIVGAKVGLSRTLSTSGADPMSGYERNHEVPANIDSDVAQLVRAADC